MPYDPSAVNDIANWIVISAAIPFALFTILYGLLAPWYRTLLGSVLFGLIFFITMVLLFILARRWWGDFWGYEWFAIGIYSMLTLFATMFLLIFIRERRGSDLLEMPVNRNHKEKK